MKENQMHQGISEEDNMKTKIITTIGPASSSYEVLEKFILEGVDVFRINFSHGNHEDHEKTIKTVHELNRKHKRHAAVLADLQGPKIRIGELKEEFIKIHEDDIIYFGYGKKQIHDDVIPVDYKGFTQDLSVGEMIQIDDGRLLLEVTGKPSKDKIETKVLYGGKLLPRKGINLPHTRIKLPGLTNKDMADLDFILTQSVQWIALSFVRSASDIIELKHHIREKTKRKEPLIVAKIEKPEAVKDIDNIIDKADALMIARGDLGIEMPLEEVPLIQKKIVKLGMTHSKPTIIATQMMEGMISNFSPTRAEVNDVANAVMDGADGLMLSGETSVGHNPVRVVQVMKKIIGHVEAYQDIYYKNSSPEENGYERFISDSIVYNACEMAQQVKARAIVGLTHSGYTAFEIAGQRPKAAIYAFTNDHSIVSKLSLVWGVTAFYYDKFISTDHTIEDILLFLKKEGLIQKGDLVINTASTPLNKLSKTNMMKLSVVE